MQKVLKFKKLKETKKTVVTTNDWTNIPHYPTTREKRENVVKYLMSMGKQVPQELLRKIAIDKQKEVEQDLFNNFNNSSQEEEPPVPPVPPTQEQIYRSQVQQNIMRQQQMRQQQQQPPHKYSPQYAAYIGTKPRAQASARIGMVPRR